MQQAINGGRDGRWRKASRSRRVDASYGPTLTLEKGLGFRCSCWRRFVCVLVFVLMSALRFDCLKVYRENAIDQGAGEMRVGNEQEE